MKIATWNVNSLKARLEHVKRFLSEQAPDVLMMQELKGLEFPEADFTALGYQSIAVAQKAYNGVAILSKFPIRTVLNHLENDEPARYLEVEVNFAETNSPETGSPPYPPASGGELNENKPPRLRGGKGGSVPIRLINIYLPNGNPWPGEKFDYKLRWMQNLKNRVQFLQRQGIPFLIGGDFNVIPEGRDCYDPKAWENDALYRIETRTLFRAMLHLGMTDAFRVHDQQSHQYTFWDYQAGSWQSGKGIRIDHFLLSPHITDRMLSCTIDASPRGWDRPSDHTPVILEIA